MAAMHRLAGFRAGFLVCVLQALIFLIWRGCHFINNLSLECRMPSPTTAGQAQPLCASMQPTFAQHGVIKQHDAGRREPVDRPAGRLK